jgi:hypothetical protein
MFGRVKVETVQARPVLNNVALALPSLRETTVLSYSLIGDRIAVWAYDDRGIVFFWVRTSSRELLHLVDKFERLCASPDSSIAAVLQEGHQLYNLLIAARSQPPHSEASSRIRGGRCRT